LDTLNALKPNCVGCNTYHAWCLSYVQYIEREIDFYIHTTT